MIRRKRLILSLVILLDLGAPLALADKDLLRSIAG